MNRQNMLRQRINFALGQINRGKKLYFDTNNDTIKRSVARLIMNNHRDLINYRKELKSL